VTLTLHVDSAAWQQNARAVLARHRDVMAVVKGNGYGFGRERLARMAHELGVEQLAVGTVYELGGVSPGPAPIVVLTPTDPAGAALGANATLTVGSIADVESLATTGHRGGVLVKLASSMRRYGAERGELPAVLAAVSDAGLMLDGFAVHLPLNGEATEIESWLDVLPAGVPVSVSHVDPDSLERLRARHPDRRFPIRLGTALWHGDKTALALRADVVATRAVKAGERAGYRQVYVPGDGDLVMVGTGTAHGVRPLPDGRSPFHFAHHRLLLLEPPHMHTSMVWVPGGTPSPRRGDAVDVQQPLTFVTPDRIVER
jgi:alanine racemase